MGRKIVLEDHLAKLRDRGIDIEAGDEKFHIDPPQLWPDTVDGLDELETAKVILGGEERYNAFLAAGGSYRMLGSIIEGGFGETIPE